MKKYFAGFFVLLCLLMGASALRAEPADAVRDVLSNLPPQFKVTYGDIKGEGNLVTISQLKISYAASAESEERNINIESLEISNLNTHAFLGSEPSPLADKIVARKLAISGPEGCTITLKQLVIDKPSAAWGNLRRLVKEDDRAEFWRQLAQARIEAAVVEEVIMINDSGSRDLLAIERVSARDLGLLQCADMRIANFKYRQALSSTEFSIADSTLRYNLHETFLPVLQQPDFKPESFYKLDPSRHYSYYVLSNSIKSNIDKMPFTIKSITFQQETARSASTGKFVLDSFQMKADDIKSFNPMAAEIHRHLLGVKPFILSMEIDSSLAAGKFLPSNFKMRMPGLCDIDFSAMLGLTADYLEKWRPRTGGLNNMMDAHFKYVLKTSLLQKLFVSYQDKGLIDGAAACYAQMQGISKAQVKNEAMKGLDDAMRNQQGLFRDLLKNLKSLIQKPGYLSLSLTPRQPLILDQLEDILRDNPSQVDYSFQYK